jgi:sugar O-acyltransferase (sialic acid O-acetyltransferase NeuD family)
MRYAVFGVGGCGRGVMPLMRQQLSHIPPDSYELIFVDDNVKVTLCNGSRVMTYYDWLRLPASRRSISLAIADSQARKILADRCRKDGVEFFEVRAGNTVQLDDVSIGEGAILCPFVTLTSNIRIGKHFHANLYSYVEHDCVIGDFVTFAPGVKCNGNIVIEDYAYIGAGAVIKQGSSGMPLVIGRGAVIGMGAVVTQSVPAGATVIGNPARALVRAQAVT